MRAIDADVLKRHIDKLPALPDGNFAGNHSALKALINMQPTIEPSTNNSEIPNNSDTISRAKAIEALTEYGRAVYIGVDTAVGCIDQLPPAQPEPIRINLNEPIKVKLTDWGKEIYYHQYDKANQIAGREICKPKFPEEDENGYTEIQLWCFVELYGEHMGMTLPNVIEPLEIVYERRTG